MNNWKNTTFAVGLTLLVYGALLDLAPDWDIPLSIIMAGLTYLTATYSLLVILERRWGELPLAVFYTWLTVDGCYWSYWSWVNPEALVMRAVNFPASLALYFVCAILWLLPDVANRQDPH